MYLLLTAVTCLLPSAAHWPCCAVGSVAPVPRCDGGSCAGHQGPGQWADMMEHRAVSPGENLKHKWTQMRSNRDKGKHDGTQGSKSRGKPEA